MNDFIEKEKNKIKDFEKKLAINHEEKKKEKQKPKFYQNVKTGDIISEEEYRSLFLITETNPNLGMNNNGIVQITPILEEESLNPKELYAPYVPDEE